ncbi:hypothetical protein DICPUDRAFT_151051 [Dictyostelium purpureum]|uniref:G-protein coupled receptors family 2 profile 2 domain-containing protein n=1 Tax=Dictyostelium purpureum TaxID=5786 RepID=F0ZHV8_DICPU|nr:uncharacterized protein DICPUDRAFT_151051 [Dictyostelium purpureum]EGC36490.1 hypothetical protein DICPUDRAFT_151051 [Dictyostelium purpureum]|eukprot:XP_003287003.1 hypothetical protein DICPUDRAFT_151051 [Dictyostelium purpureum]
MKTSYDNLNIALGYITDIFLCLSIIGSFLTIFTFILFYRLRSFPIRLIVYLCFSIFFAHLFFEVSYRSAENLFCIPSAILIHYFFLADFFWTFCVSFNFFQMIVKRNRDAESFELYYHLISWGIPLVIVILCSSFQKYINKGGFCYLENDLPIYLGFFVPGLIIVCANSITFFFTAREIQKTFKHSPPTKKKEKSKQFRVYFSIFISIGFSWLFGFITVFFKNGSIPQYIFQILFSITTTLQGFLIFVSYCLNNKVFAHYARALTALGVPFFERFQHLDSTSATGTYNNTSNGTHLRTMSDYSKNTNQNTESTDSSVSIKNSAQQPA